MSNPRGGRTYQIKPRDCCQDNAVATQNPRWRERQDALYHEIIKVLELVVRKEMPPERIPFIVAWMEQVVKEHHNIQDIIHS